MKRVLLCILTLGLLVGTTGCLSTGLAAVASLGTGWLLGAMTVPRTTDYLCYRNGVEIDCSELPPSLARP